MAHPSLSARDPIRLAPRAPDPVPARSGPVVLVPRRLPGGVLATLDGLPDEALPRLDYRGPASGLRRATRAALAERLPRPRWLANWLLDDVLDHAALLVELTGAAALRVSLGPSLDRGADATFDGALDGALDAARSRCRLVTAYRGPGFDWLPPRAAMLAAGTEFSATAPGGPPYPELQGALRRLPRGDVAVLRGDGGVEASGVLHRAASGSAGIGTPLLLAIDDLGRPPRSPRARTASAAPFADRPAGALQ